MPRPIPPPRSPHLGAPAPSRLPLRRVVSIGDERVGPHGGRTRLCALECGHLKAWSSSQPRRLFAPPRLVPQRMRCLLCGIGCAPAPLLEALELRELVPSMPLAMRAGALGVE